LLQQRFRLSSGFIHSDPLNSGHKVCNNSLGWAAATAQRLAHSIRQSQISAFKEESKRIIVIRSIFSIEIQTHPSSYVASIRCIFMRFFYF
jgi:hypothetical protein